MSYEAHVRNDVAIGRCVSPSRSANRRKALLCVALGVGDGCSTSGYACNEHVASTWLSYRTQAISNAKSRQGGWLVGDIAPRKVSLERHECLDMWSNEVGIALVRHERKAYSCSNRIMVSINQCSRLNATCIWVLAS